jgi:hypothetical protein
MILPGREAIGRRQDGRGEERTSGHVARMLAFLRLRRFIH